MILAAFHALVWPHCLQRLEGVSPEVEQLWLSHVREARPDLPPRLARRDAGPWPCRYGRDRLDGAGLAAAAASRNGSAAYSRRPRPGDRRDRPAVVADAHRAGRADARQRWRRGAGLDPRPMDAGALRRPLVRVLGTSAVVRARCRRGTTARASTSFPKEPTNAEARRSARPTGCAHAVGTEADCSTTEGHGVHVHRPRSAVDRGHSPRCRGRPLSPQRPADCRRDERFSRRRGTGAPDHQEISLDLSADVPQQLDDDDLPVGGAQRFLCSARAGPGAELAYANGAARRIRRSRCGG